MRERLARLGHMGPTDNSQMLDQGNAPPITSDGTGRSGRFIARRTAAGHCPRFDQQR